MQKVFQLFQPALRKVERVDQTNQQNRFSPIQHKKSQLTYIKNV